MVDLNMGYFIVYGVMKALPGPAFHNTNKKHTGNDAKGHSHYYHQASFSVAPYVLPSD